MFHNRCSFRRYNTDYLPGFSRPFLSLFCSTDREILWKAAAPRCNISLGMKLFNTTSNWLRANLMPENRHQYLGNKHYRELDEACISVLPICRPCIQHFEHNRIWRNKTFSSIFRKNCTMAGISPISQFGVLK